MKFFRLFVPMLLGIMALSVRAQIVTTSPSPVTQESSPIVITFHAAEGNGGLKGLVKSTAVYAHTGVILKGQSNWSHDPKWLDNSDKYKMEWVSSSTYQLTIPSIKEYYGLADGEEVSKLAFVFRNADGSKEGKTASGGDIFVDVVQAGEVTDPVNDPVARTYPGGVPEMGPVKQSDGSVLFCLAAPGKEYVNIIGSWNDYKQAADTYYQDYEGVRYFWWKVDGLKSATDYLYYFIVDKATYVGDPYARLVLDQDNDKYIPSDVFPDMPAYPSGHAFKVPVAVYNSEADTYNWKNTDFKGVDKSALVIYELLIRDFTGTEGEARGNGTVRGVINKLPYLKSLGVNAIELLPIMEFAGNLSWGYNPNFYFAPDKAYGTPDDYRELIDAAHGQGMAVILDIVFNQTDGQHPWWVMYTPATNPLYNASAPHSYSVLNDWKQEHPLVQRQFCDALRYWLTAYKVDGFRFDLVKGLGDDNSYKAVYDKSKNTWSGVTEENTNAYNATRVARMKALHEAMREVNPNAYFINENLAGAEEENAMAADGELNWANINNASCQFAMGWPSDCMLNRFYAPDDSRTVGSTVSYAESHDEERMAYKVGAYGASGIKGNIPMTMRRLGSVAAMMLMSPGAHMLWQFQEFGADQTTKNSGGNDTGNKTVVWNYLDNPDRAALKDTYSTLIKLRSSYPQLFGDAATTVMNCNVTNNTWPSMFSIKLSNGSRSEICCVVNPAVSGTSAVTVPFSSAPSAYKLLASSTGVTPTLNGSSVSLPAGAFAVFGLADMSGIEDIADGGNVKVLGGHGTITVMGEYRTLNVSDMSGRMLNRTTSLAPGIYLVIVDGVTHKVIVR